MYWIKLPLVHLSLFYTLGILLANRLFIHANQIFAAVFYLLCFAFLTHKAVHKTSRKPKVFNLSIWGIVFLLGVYNYHNSIPRTKANVGAFTQFVITEKLKETSYYSRYYGEQIGSEARKSKKLLLRVKKDSSCTPLLLGQIYLTNLELNPIPKPKNPYQFNYAEYLFYQGIGLQVQGSNNFIRPLNNTKETLAIRAKILQQQLASRFAKYIKNESNLGTVKALLLGERSSLDPEVKSDFAKSGIMHILAISGLHLGIISLLVSRITQGLKRFRYGVIFQLSILVSVLWSFALITGLSASVVRAALMFTIFSIGSAIGRRHFGIHGLIVSFFILLLFNPLYLFQVGFKMSYAAVFAILWLYPEFKKIINPKLRITRLVWDTLSVSFIAQLGVLPISLYYFNSFPVYFLLANFLILPCIAPIIGLGIFSLIGNIVHPEFTFGFKILEWSVNTISSLAEWVSRLPNAQIEPIRISEVQLTLSYLLLIGLIIVLKHKKRYSLRYLACSGLLLFWTIVTQEKNMQKDRLWVFNTIGETAVVAKNINKLTVYSNTLNTNNWNLNGITANLKIESVATTSLPNYFIYKECSILIVDRVIPIPEKLMQLDYLILTNNVKIHLEQWINSIKPQMIIADASNFPNTIERWKTTANKKQVEFYPTPEKGAFEFK